MKGLQAVLKTGRVIMKYVYCDVDSKHHAIVPTLLQRVSEQYPEQFPISAWSNALTDLPKDVHDITPRHWKRIGHVDMIIAGTECPPFSQAAKGAQGYADDRARIVPAVVQNIHYLYEIQGDISYIVENVPNAVNFPENIRLLGNEYVILNGVQLGS